MFGEACLDKRNFKNELNLYKEGWISIQEEKRQDSPTMADWLKANILTERRVAIEDISEQLAISRGTVHKIVHDDIAFSKVRYQ